MHEMSLVQNLFQQLEELAAAHGKSKVTKVTMIIGPLSGVVADSFRFGFDALSGDSALVSGAELIIEVPEAQFRCSMCSHIETTNGTRPESCAKCGEPFLVAAGGDDLLLKQIELE